MMAKSPVSHTLDALFDLKNDPDEMRNLLGDPNDRVKYAGRGDEMKQRLLAWLEHVHAPIKDCVRERKLT